jgi:hypothetical protein
MSEPPFEPPPSDVDDRPPRRAPSGSPLRAIVVGLVVDLGGSVVLSLLLMIVYAASLQHAGLSPEQLKAAIEHIPSNSWPAVLELVLGSLLDVFSGFVCARIAQRDEWRVGATLAAISTLCAALLGDGGDSTDELTLLRAACTLACTLLGVKYGRESNHRPVEAVAE